MSSVIFPWIGTYDAKELPQYEGIAAALRLAGDLARLHGQRITFHPRCCINVCSSCCSAGWLAGLLTSNQAASKQQDKHVPSPCLQPAVTL